MTDTIEHALDLPATNELWATVRRTCRLSDDATAAQRWRDPAWQPTGHRWLDLRDRAFSWMDAVLEAARISIDEHDVYVNVELAAETSPGFHDVSNADALRIVAYTNDPEKSYQQDVGMLIVIFDDYRTLEEMTLPSDADIDRLIRKDAETLRQGLQRALKAFQTLRTGNTE